jgi:hypothetical protein
VAGRGAAPASSADAHTAIINAPTAHTSTRSRYLMVSSFGVLGAPCAFVKMMRVEDRRRHRR